jgi:hypothetical protein
MGFTRIFLGFHLEDIFLSAPLLTILDYKKLHKLYYSYIHSLMPYNMNYEDVKHHKKILKQASPQLIYRLIH